MPFSPYLTMAIAASISIPIVLLSVFGYDINPAFGLAPLVAYAIVVALPDRLVICFLAAAVGGLISITGAHYVLPEDPMRSTLGLTLMLLSPSFLFLGRWMSMRGEATERLVFWLSVGSAVFLIPVVARLLIEGEPVRGAIGWQGFAVLNAEWLTLPVFATFGVISLAYLIVLQMIILAGSLFLNVSKPMKVVFFVALVCAGFMVLGSESRAAQLCVLWLATTAVIAALKFRDHRPAVALVLLAISISLAATFSRVPADETRLARSAATVLDMASGAERNERDAEMEDLSTGRLELITVGISEVKASPWIGNGFSSYARYADEEASGHLAHNSSTHVYYLTVLWKGGLVFALPLLVFFGIGAWQAFKMRPWKTPAGFFITSAILLAFGPMALTWDILYVPSAGALAWLLLGVISADRMHRTANVVGSTDGKCPRSDSSSMSPIYPRI